MFNKELLKQHIANKTTKRHDIHKNKNITSQSVSSMHHIHLISKDHQDDYPTHCCLRKCPLTRNDKQITTFCRKISNKDRQ